MNYPFQQFTPYQYMLIDIANNFGEYRTNEKGMTIGLDQEDYQTRLNWARENMSNFEAIAEDASDPYLFKKSVKNLREVQAGKPTGALVRFDAICSGIQLLSVMTRCIRGCEATGAINSGIRANAYLSVQSVMEDLLERPVVATYKQIKAAVMTSCYGSKKVPRDLFSGDELDAFNKACRIVAPGAFGMLNPMKNTWDSKALSHSWTMPDAYDVYIPVMVTDIIKLEIEELGGYAMSTLVTENRTKEFSVSNIAHITHACDGYMVRSLVRYCNYNVDQVNKVIKLIVENLSKRKDETHVDTNLRTKIDKLNLLDITIINDINGYNIHTYPKDILELLLVDLETMISYPPFEIVPVHDCFGVSPVHMNHLRFWYNEILARLSNSNLLEDILSQLYKDEVNLRVFPDDISDLLRASDYAIN